MACKFCLASTGNNTLTSNANVSDVFAIMSFKGTDIINGFETSSAVGANHDYIDCKTACKCFQIPGVNSVQ